MALSLIATLTSAFFLLEIVVAPVAKGDELKRKKFSWILGLCIFIVGIPSTLSYGVLSHITWFDKSIFDAADFLVSNILMPLGSLLIAIFVPLKLSKETLFNELSQGSSISKKLFVVWYMLLKYVAPVVIIFVFLDALGII